MKFNVKRILKGSLISLAVLGMIGGSLNIPNVNARRRYRTHRVYRHRARRPIYRFGYWRHYRFHYYKTGYFRNGHWIRTVHKASRRRYARHARRTHRRRTRTHYTHSRRIRRMNRRARRVRRSHPRRTTRRKTYHFMGRTYYNAILNDDLYDNPDGPVKKHVRRSHKRNNHVRANKTSSNRASKQQATSTQAATVQNDSNNYYGGTDSTTPSQATTNSNGLSSNSDGFTIPSNNQWTNTFINQMKEQTLTDMNNDRAAHGVAPLQVSPELEQIAQMRTNPSQSESHIDPNTGVPYFAEDAPKLGYNNVPSDSLGENIASSNLGDQINDDNGDVIGTNRNGYDMANQEENSMMYHDGPKWGHRENILSPNYTKVGIGVGYNPSSTNFDLSEDFTGPSYNQSISQN